MMRGMGGRRWRRMPEESVLPCIKPRALFGASVSFAETYRHFQVIQPSNTCCFSSYLARFLLRWWSLRVFWGGGASSKMVRMRAVMWCEIRAPTTAMHFLTKIIFVWR